MSRPRGLWMCRGLRSLAAIIALLSRPHLGQRYLKLKLFFSIYMHLKKVIQNLLHLAAFEGFYIFQKSHYIYLLSGIYIYLLSFF